MSSKKTPGINSSSTADIAFLLLCYFLMSSSMGSQSGLSRRLPPMPAEDQQLTDQKVNRRNIIVVRINSSDRLFAGSEPIDISMLKDRIKIFLTNPNNDPDLPERKMTAIEGLGEEYPVSQGVISLQNDRGTSYQAYIAVLPGLHRSAERTCKGHQRTSRRVLSRTLWQGFHRTRRGHPGNREGCNPSEHFRG